MLPTSLSTKRKAATTYPIPLEIEGLQFYHHQNALQLEQGGQLPELTIAYHSYGQLNDAGDNVIWVCHALTANSDVADWWPGMLGAGLSLDPEKHFIICANILGSCYGSTGPRSIDPAKGEAYGLDFPAITIRDIVNAHDLLRQHLGINSIKLCIGGSCGGHQVLEYALMNLLPIKQIAILANSARETAWAIAIHEAGRMTLEADPTFFENTDKAGRQGIKGARAVGLLGYRTIEAYIRTQSDEEDLYDGFRAASYIQYQGNKLEKRFYAHCYWHLLKALDTHNIGRHRGGVEQALASLDIPALVIGISSDMLIPVSQQRMMAQHLPQATYREVVSDYGHDGFLIEVEQISGFLEEWKKKVERIELENSSD